ncbi:MULTISPECIES: bis(5'-nucleosyl)-tetraphosphatase (symmetrical) YqeK [Planococcus]|uniref:bis(5'-nucleosyl)-tetraphosphatase (symmetrical) n=1 Tax=Planococcus faecalis TaxID=1598147 RepID=A0ABN4XK03_9BACL|nr:MULTISPECIES: bis(5'-nucleosyl)-tetraphosphatase (symmetrical) YqeK [Planococcus]AQU79116.1 phosphohydrolase [Planococcus faecalis]MDJ0331058.1 bis(5'-nucleosyl)-tetraphosphatase (symmetrical) YqeK [Planococcus sp. S3-L1]OHX51751.1 phosphohydrolase [Planococcus faecalis]
MDHNHMLQTVKERLPENRFTHVLGVVDTATELAKAFKVSESNAQTAAILHDVAKFSDREWMKSVIVSENMDPLLLEYHAELWHAPVGAHLAKSEFGVTDEDVLNAIRYHTTGREAMSDLEKVVYIADLIEPNRKFSGVEELRQLKNQGLDVMMEAAIKHSIEFLKSKNQPVFPDSLKCYNYFVQQKGKVKE